MHVYLVLAIYYCDVNQCNNLNLIYIRIEFLFKGGVCIKRVNMFIIVIMFTLSIVGCSAEDPKQGVVDDDMSISLETGDDIDILKTKIGEYPNEYSANQGVADGHFVVLHGTRQNEVKQIEDFIADGKTGKKGELILLSYTIEGDPIFTGIYFDGEKYYSIKDNTRDKFGIPKVSVSEGYNHLAIVKDSTENQGGSNYVVLSNDENITNESLMATLASSDLETSQSVSLITVYADV